MPELVDEIRVPLHELQADVDYLIGRVIADPTCSPTIAASIKGKLAAIEAAALILNEPQSSWQPIETAPKNHLPVQIYGPYGQLTAFRDVTWAWWTVPAYGALEYQPTHWMPLPAGPSVTRPLLGGGQ